MPRKYQKREPEFPAPDAAPAAAAEVDRIDVYRKNPDGGYTLIEGGIDIGQGLPAPPVAPPPPNPAVIALQEDIVRLIRSRSEVRVRMLQAHATLQNAQSNFQIAQSEMKGIEDEVQYLHGQVAQLEGRRQEPLAYVYTTSSDNLTIMPPVHMNVSSEPTMPMNRPGSPFASPDGINRAHANRADVI